MGRAPEKILSRGEVSLDHTRQLCGVGDRMSLGAGCVCVCVSPRARSCPTAQLLAPAIATWATTGSVPRASQVVLGHWSGRHLVASRALEKCDWVLVLALAAARVLLDATGTPMEHR